ncbi:Sulfate transport system permease protein CysW [Roseivivax jejudonensis]|uniref:Sulfate transport system permease protein CysW n=2 Tax=Roseivivax jejudonensis TaxID=1529041 RepID=A0A1X6ZZX8_9RHOB|nr:Sulfate transport system permease protein CysW [Roseivivax jejudonensis]
MIPKRVRMGAPAFRVLGHAVAALVLLPLIAVAVAALTGSLETLTHLWQTVLPRYLGTTALLVATVSAGTAVIGAGTAWLVSCCAFPGRRFLEVALVLPLAFPAYVVAYAYTDLLDHPGLVQTTLRAVMGWGPRDYWFPEIRSAGGAAAMLTLVLYPYVYLLTRAAFLGQGARPFNIARTLGAGPWGAFLRVALPMARPSIAAGVLLAAMETIADYGTVSYFGVQSLANGIYQSWFSMADRGAAAQLALGLLAIALLLATLEQRSRGAAQHHSNGAPLPRIPLGGAARWAASAACALPVMLGAVVPAVTLATMATGSNQSLLSERYLQFAGNSVLLAAIAAGVTVLAAIVIGYQERLSPGPLSRATVRIGRIGYAVPGGVIAVGLLVPFAAFDNALDAFMEARFGISTGLLVTGSIWLMIAAYLIRFLAAAIGAYEGGQAMVNPNVGPAARSLGKGPYIVLTRVHLPIMSPSLLTALLIVFIDTMKELPATLILRPFNFDTLAVQAHRLAADERLDGAAVPSLAIAAVGLLPVIVLIRRIGAGDR